MHPDLKNPSLAPPSLFYFGYFGAMAALIPFLALFYASLGLNATQIGFLSSLFTLVTLFGAPVMNGLADATHRHSLILRVLILGSMGGVFLLSTSHSIATIIPAMVLYAFTFAPIAPLVDASVLSLLGDRSDRYGSVRVWGSVGWSVMALGVGALTESVGLSWIFYTFLLIMGGVLVVTLWMPIRPQAIRVSFRRGMGQLLRDPKWFAFLAVAITIGIAVTVVNNFLNLYMDTLGYSRTLIGLAMTLSSLSEIPVMFTGHRLLARFKPRRMLMVGLCIYVVRLLIYSLAQSPAGFLIGQLLNGVSYGFVAVAGVSYAAKIAPYGLESTAQGLFNMALFGVSGVLGGIVGGFLYDTAGPAELFRWVALAGVVGLVFFIGLPEEPVNR